MDHHSACPYTEQMHFDPGKSETLRRPISWLLVLAFLCQPILTYLTTPEVVQTREGFRAVICTLQGARHEVYVDLPSIDATAKAVSHCPALKLVQLAGIVQPVEPLEPPRRVLHALGIVAWRVPWHGHVRPFFVYAPRAPPISSLS